MRHEANSAYISSFLYKILKNLRLSRRISYIPVNKYSAAFTAIIFYNDGLYNAASRLHALNLTFYPDKLTEVSIIVIGFFSSHISYFYFFSSFKYSNIDCRKLLVSDIFTYRTGYHYPVASAYIVVIDRENVDSIAVLVLDVNCVEKGISCFRSTVSDSAYNGKHFSIAAGSCFFYRAYFRLFLNHFQYVLSNYAVGIAYLIFCSHLKVRAKYCS